MPFIRGRYHINPVLGEALEAAREAEAALLELEQQAQRDYDNGEQGTSSGEERGAGEDRANRNNDRIRSRARQSARQADRQTTDQLTNQATDHLTDRAMHRPIGRVEIEAAEMVPSHTGTAQRGFVARVHRQPIAGNGAEAEDSGSSSPMRQFVAYNSSSALPQRGGSPAQAETHVFSDHRDLVNFLRDELARDCENQAH
jgi:hypothetical protein